jgi:hypothetical protein
MGDAMATARRFVSCTLPLVTLSFACSDPIPPTEVVVVMQSDLSVPIDTDGVQFSVIGGPFAPDPTSRGANTTATVLTDDFPVSVRVIDDRSASSFSATAQLLKGLRDGTVVPSIVVSRTITDVPFSAQQTMMLVLPMPRRCACQGSTCPTPGDPECDNVAQPTLQPFDPAVAPPNSFTRLGSIGLPAPAIGNH